MNEEKWAKLGAMAGVLFAAVAVVAFALVPVAPEGDKPIEEIVDYFVEERGGLLAGTYLYGLAGFFFVWFLGTLRSALRRAEGGTGALSAIAYAGGLAGLVLALGSVGSFGALAFSAGDELDASTVRALFDLGNMSINLSGFGFAALLGATAAVAIGTSVLPTWVGWGSVLLGALQLVAPYSIFVESGAFATGGAVGLAAFVFFLAWAALVSVMLLVRVGAAEPGG